MRFSVILLLLLASACASSGDFDMLRRDVNELKRESSEARKDIDALKEKSSSMVREDSFSAVRESQADLNSRVSQVTSGLQELRGRYEENKYSVEKTLKDTVAERDLLRAQLGALESQVKTLRDRLAALQDQKPVEPAAKAPDETKAEPEKTEPAKETPPAEKTEAPDDAKKAYETAYQDFKDKKYRAAREKFEAFIKGHPRHELADNAQFWVAETYYAEKDFEGSILAYETLLKKYPNSKKTSGALLKQGLAFIEIGDKKTGKTILSRLVEKYPHSTEAGAARKKLAELEKKPNRKK